MTQTTLEFETLTCPSCMHKITNAVNELSGVDRIKILFDYSKARVEFDSERISEKEIINKIEEMGYNVKS